jgi:deoxyribodipyrimidine photo-lyase
MSKGSPVLLWFRRDLRLADHPALHTAAETGRPVIPVFLLDEVVERHGAAPKWRLGLGVEHLAARLEAIGTRLVLRKGDALPTLRALVKATGAGAVWWTRLYDPDARKRDEAVKAGLRADGIEARSFPGHLLFEPWTVETGQGGFYRVHTPFWNAVKNRDPGRQLPAPSMLTVPAAWPDSDEIAAWDMGAAMRRGARVVAEHINVGEEAARGRLAAFIGQKIADYAEARDFPAEDGTSQLSENLTYGEISTRACWHAGMRAREVGKRGAETFLKELVWREFAYHLIHHTPHIVAESWRAEWRDFPWNREERRARVRAWKRGRTGIEFVDAAMREMYVTGKMHNRGRMIVASYLTKHLITDWRIGLKWFEDCLIDWDPASNALGWQWSAGSGPDAAPYFRVFNPETQAAKFDADSRYRRKWIAEGQGRPPSTALAYFEAIPKGWLMTPADPYPESVVAPAEGRKRALAVYEEWKG